MSFFIFLDFRYCSKQSFEGKHMPNSSKFSHTGPVSLAEVAGLLVLVFKV